MSHTNNEKKDIRKKIELPGDAYHKIVEQELPGEKDIKKGKDRPDEDDHIDKPGLPKQS